MKEYVMFGLLLLLVWGAAAQEGNGTNETSTEENVTTIQSADLTDFFPKEFSLGDIQLNIQVKNTGTVPLHNLGAFITGNGISTYNTIPLENVAPGEKGFILVFVNAKQAGTIPLEVRILDQTYKLQAGVTDPNAGLAEEERKKKEEQARLAEELLQNKTLLLKQRTEELTKRLDGVEEQYYQKKNDRYILRTDPKDAKTYLRTAQADLIRHDVDGTEANLVQLESELVDIERDLSTAQQEKRPFGSIIKDNITWITALLTAIIASITLIGHFSNKAKLLREQLRRTKEEKVSEPKKKSS